MDQDIRAIEAAVKIYLDGLYEGDADKLASVFHPTSSLTCEEVGTLTPIARDEWLKAVRGRPSGGKLRRKVFARERRPSAEESTS